MRPNPAIDSVGGSPSPGAWGYSAAMTDRIDPTELIVKSKVKTLLRESDMNASSEIWTELGHTLTRTLKRAIARAKANKRKTVKACDI